MKSSNYIHTAGFRSMMSYIVYQALNDLKAKSKRTRRLAKEFLLSSDCEMYCMAIGFNHELIEEIDFDNPSNSLNFNATVKSDTIIDDYDDIL